MLRDMVAAGMQSLRDGSVIACARAAPRDYLHFSAGFSRSDPRPSRFPWRMETYFAAKRRLFELRPPGAVGVTMRTTDAEESSRYNRTSGHYASTRLPT